MKNTPIYCGALVAVMLAPLLWCGCGCARKTLQQKAEQGDVQAQYDLGTAYYYGEGVPQDVGEGIKWLRKAGAQGHLEAQCWLGWAYFQGKGVPQDYVEAYRWANLTTSKESARRVKLSIDIERQMTRAQLSEGRKRAAEFRAKNRDKPDAKENGGTDLEQIRKEADQDGSDAQYNLGVAYREGQGVSKDYAMSVSWFLKAAEQGNTKAYCALGVAFREGQGVRRNYTESASWYRKAAEQGDAGAQVYLGQCYSTGQGVPNDFTEAYKWFSLAAATTGDKETIKKRDELMANLMTPDQIAEGNQLVAEFSAKKKATSENK